MQELDDRTSVAGGEENRAPTAAEPRRKLRCGFAAMSPDQRREIARRGGRAAHAKGTAHEFTPEEARIAGRLGGTATQAKRAARAQPT